MRAVYAALARPLRWRHVAAPRPPLNADARAERRRGIALITLATVAFSVIDASAKWLVQSLPVVQVVWLRFAVHVLLMALLLAPTQGRALVRMTNWRLQALRAAMMVAMTALNFAALRYLQLAETAAIQFSVPILIAVLSTWWLGEHLSPQRWVAIGLGFAGVLLVVRPGLQGFHPAIGLSLLNALLYAGFNLLTRRMVATESPASMQFLSALGPALMLAPLALADWQWPRAAGDWLVIGACGLAGGLGHLAVAHAHRHASAAVLGPFLYQQILYMSAWGWLVFGQVPDALVVAGAAVVVGSGLYLLWLEVRHR